MKKTTMFLIGLSVAPGLAAYALNEAVLPLMGDDRLYNTAPVPMPLAEAAATLMGGDSAPAAVQGLDMTMTGTRSSTLPLGSSQKRGLAEGLSDIKREE